MITTSSVSRALALLMTEKDIIFIDSKPVF